jgi:hypothetical protein
MRQYQSVFVEASSSVVSERTLPDGPSIARDTGGGRMPDALNGLRRMLKPVEVGSR